jgi:hypothetical protein
VISPLAFRVESERAREEECEGEAVAITIGYYNPKKSQEHRGGGGGDNLSAIIIRKTPKARSRERGGGCTRSAISKERSLKPRERRWR